MTTLAFSSEIEGLGESF